MDKIYSIKLDKRSNGILIKKGNKLIHMIATPPGNGVFLLNIETEYECNYKGLILRRSNGKSLLYYLGKVIDIKL